MDPSTPAPDTANTSPALSTGLGGPLWLLAWALAMLPPVFTAESIASVWRYPPILDPGDHFYLLHNVTSVWRLLLVIVLWRAAVLFFRRSHGFPACWWLLVAILWLGLVVTQALRAELRGDTSWRWSMLFDMTMKDSLFLLTPVALALYLSLSPHARRAFRGIGAAVWGPPALPSVLRHGPDDWSRGFWLMPGLLIYAVLLHATEVSNVAAEALQPVPPSKLSGTEDASGFAAMMHSELHVYAARLQWGLHLLALSLLPFVGYAFVRRRPRTVWLVVALLAVTIAAPLVWIVIDPPPMYLDGPDHEVQLLRAIALALIMLPALWSARRRGRFGRAPEAVPGAGPDPALSGGTRDSGR